MKRWLKRLFYSLILLFVLTNIVLYNHAYNFTHFVDKDIPKVKMTTAKDLGSLTDKLSLAFWGIETPKSKNTSQPDSVFEAFTLGSSPQLHAWWIPTTQSPKGVIILLHGYTASKSSQLPVSRVLRRMGYHTMLLDFRGHGDSEGLETSIGYHEAEDVKTAYDYVKTYYEDLPIVLFGTSMGAVAALKAQADYQMDIDKLIIECPFGTLSDAVYARFDNMGIPQVILPEILLFWGGLHTNINAHEHDAALYAAKVTKPTLHIYGKQDPKVRMEETQAVFKALAGPKRLIVLDKSGHDYILLDDPEGWENAVRDFLEE